MHVFIKRTKQTKRQKRQKQRKKQNYETHQPIQIKNAHNEDFHRVSRNLQQEFLIAIHDLLRAKHYILQGIACLGEEMKYMYSILFSNSLYLNRFEVNTT